MVAGKLCDEAEAVKKVYSFWPKIHQDVKKFGNRQIGGGFLIILMSVDVLKIQRAPKIRTKRPDCSQ